jgi:anti-sigma factor RsiW
MTQEIMNRLIMDRSLGGLAPDAAALLDAYLEREPELSRTAGEIEDTVRLAKQALSAGPSAELPPLKVLPLPDRPAARSPQRRASWPAQLAAALILGVGLGFLAFRPGPPARAAAGSAPVTPMAQAVQSGSPNAFWSVKRLAQLEPKTTSTRGPRVTWNAWLQNPQVNN